MTSLTSNSTNVSPILVTVQFSEPVADFDALLDVTPGNATISNFVVVDGDTYTFDLTPLGQGAVTASFTPRQLFRRGRQLQHDYGELQPHL